MANDHFVPKTYLRPFTNDNNHLNVYFKATDKFCRNVSIKKVASIEDFYTLTSGFVADGQERYLERSFFQNIDSQWRNMRQGLERITSLGIGLEDSLRHQVAEYLSIQVVRTPVFRNFVTAFIEDHYKRREFAPPPSPYVLGTKLSRETAAFVHARDITSNLPLNIAEYLTSLHWQIGVNNTKLPLFTSDNPIVWCQVSSRCEQL